MTIWNIPELRQRTEAASKPPKGDLPEVGTVVFDNGDPQVIQHIDGQYVTSALSSGWMRRVNRNWRYATPAEIDQFGRDSALPEIVDPIRAVAIELVATDNVTRPSNQVDAIREGRAGGIQVDLVVRAINRGIEIERARKAGE